MDVIKKFVDEKYHKYYETENQSEVPIGPDISDLLRNTSIQSSNASTGFELPLVLDMSSSVQQSSDTETAQSATAPSLVSSEIVRNFFNFYVPT